MANRRTNYKQHIIAGAQSNISHVQQSMQVSLPTPIYFDFELHKDTADNSEQLATPERLLTIEPGKSYLVFVSASRNSCFEQCIKQQSLILESDIELRLTCTGHTESVSKLIIEDQCIQVSCKSILSSELAFRVTVLEELPRDHIQFVLWYRELHKRGLRFAASLEVKLGGTYSLVDKRLMESCNVELDDAPPENFAILLIEQPKSRNLHLHGWNLRCGSLLADSIGWEPPNLASLIERQEKPETVLEKIQRISWQGPEELIEWLTKLCNLFRKQLYVIIAGYPNNEIPWEMLALDHENYLGAKAVVARWGRGQGLHTLDMKNVDHHGYVISYLDNEELNIAVTYPEYETLKMLQGKHYKYLEEWKTYLLYTQSIGDIGLIYMGRHGHGGISTGPDRKLSERNTALNLARSISHPNPRPIVFVNSSGSALPTSGQDTNDIGFMDVLLTHFASAYIGTLGPVESNCASKIAKRLLWTAFSNSEGVQIAEELRHLREEAANKIMLKEFKNLDASEREKRAVNFIYTFMYVFYGNPLLRLKLTKVDEAGEA